jgi:hypothetical protein
MMNEILGRAQRFQDLLTRKFGITGGAPAPQLTPEIGTEFEIPFGAQDYILCQELLASGSTIVAAVAAKKGVLQLSNPPGSNIVAIVGRESLMVNAAAANFWLSVGKGTALANLVGAGQVTRLDTRCGYSGIYTLLPACTLTYDQSPPGLLTPNVWYLNVPIGTNLTTYEPIILAPGWCAQLACDTVNIQFAASFRWREVPLAQGEAGPF